MYGGRPVIYGDKALLARLHEDDKYLWVQYDPIPDEMLGNYPLDWTHEREWRARVTERWWGNWPRPKEGVPLVLPPEYIDGEYVLSLPLILVRTLQETTDLRQWLAGLSAYQSTNVFISWLYAYCNELTIVPLDVVTERLKAGDDRWTRLETIPLDEIPLGSDSD